MVEAICFISCSNFAFGKISCFNIISSSLHNNLYKFVNILNTVCLNRFLISHVINGDVNVIKSFILEVVAVIVSLNICRFFSPSTQL